MNTRFFYRGYLLSCEPTQLEGQYQGRVAITLLAGDRTRSQRFLDLEKFDSEVQAVERAHFAGIEWIDLNDKPRQRPLKGPPQT